MQREPSTLHFDSRERTVYTTTLAHTVHLLGPAASVGQAAHSTEEIAGWSA